MDRRDTFFLESLVNYIDAKVVVEVGVQFGNMAVHLCKAAAANGGRYFGFDLWNVHGLKNQFSGFTGSKEDVSQKLSQHGYVNFYLEQVDTFGPDFPKLLDQLCPTIDFAFIDADHSYYGVAQDFNNIYPRLSDTGVIAFHDTLRIDGCREFNLDLRTKYNDGTFDIVDFPFGEGDRYCGVSLLVKRSYPVITKQIDEVCGSLSSMKEIEAREAKWYFDEAKRFKPIEVTREDMKIDRIGFYQDRSKFSD